jgi:hypothetical protein
VGEHEHEHEHEHEYQFECGYESLRVGTLGAAEVPEEMNETVDTGVDQEAAQCGGQGKIGEEADQYEWEYEGLWVGTIGTTEVPEEADITAARGLAQNVVPVEMEGGVAENEQRDLETGHPDWRIGWVRDPQCETSHRRPGDRVRSPPPAETSQPEFGVKLRGGPDRRQKEDGYDAWSRQLWSDDSSDEEEGEEWCGRFAESGRWATELQSASQHPVPTSGRECSA